MQLSSSILSYHSQVYAIYIKRLQREHIHQNIYGCRHNQHYCNHYCINYYHHYHHHRRRCLYQEKTRLPNDYTEALGNIKFMIAIIFFIFFFIIITLIVRISIQRIRKFSKISGT